MKSIDGEVVTLYREVQITPEVELWLGKLSDEMKDTLKQLLEQCLQEARMSRAGGLDPSKYPSQILCLSEMIRFTDRCSESIQKSTLGTLKKELEGQLEQYTNVDLSGGKYSAKLYVRSYIGTLVYREIIYIVIMSTTCVLA